MPFHFTFQCRHEQLHGDSDKIRPRPMGEYVLVLHRLPAGLQWREQSRERRRRWAFQGQWKTKATVVRFTKSTFLLSCLDLPKWVRSVKLPDVGIKWWCVKNNFTLRQECAQSDFSYLKSNLTLRQRVWLGTYTRRGHVQESWSNIDKNDLRLFHSTVSPLPQLIQKRGCPLIEKKIIRPTSNWIS